MKAKCIYIDERYLHHRRLELNGIYDVFENKNFIESTYAVYKDKLDLGYFSQKLFISLAQWRDDQINDILSI